MASAGQGVERGWTARAGRWPGRTGQGRPLAWGAFGSVHALVRLKPLVWLLPLESCRPPPRDASEDHRTQTASSRHLASTSVNQQRPLLASGR